MAGYRSRKLNGITPPLENLFNKPFLRALNCEFPWGSQVWHYKIIQKSGPSGWHEFKHPSVISVTSVKWRKTKRHSPLPLSPRIFFLFSGLQLTIWSILWSVTSFADCFFLQHRLNFRKSFKILPNLICGFTPAAAARRCQVSPGWIYDLRHQSFWKSIQQQMGVAKKMHQHLCS